MGENFWVKSRLPQSGQGKPASFSLIVARTVTVLPQPPHSKSYSGTSAPPVRDYKEYKEYKDDVGVKP